MLSPCDDSFLDSSNSVPNDVDPSSPLSDNVISHNVAPSSQDQCKQPLDRSLSTSNPNFSQTSVDLSNPVVQTTISRSSLSSQHRSFPSQHQSLSIETEAQNQQLEELQSSQHGISPVLSSQNSATLLADRVSSRANTDLPLIPEGDQYASPVVQHPLTPSHPFGDTTMDARPRPTGLVAVPSTTAREDSDYEMLAENTPEPREYVQRMTDGWKEDAKGVLIFTGIFSAIVASFIIDSYKRLSQGVGDQVPLQPSHPPVLIIAVNIMWLISLVLNIVSALFATLTLHWSRRFARVPRVPRAPRDRALSRSFLSVGTLTYDLDRAVAMTVMLLHLSVFLFLVGLVIFFFTIHKIVATVVTVAVGLFGVVYLTLTVLACIDQSCLYRTPLSDVWWSHRGGQGSAY